MARHDECHAVGQNETRVTGENKEKTKSESGVDECQAILSRLSGRSRPAGCEAAL